MKPSIVTAKLRRLSTEYPAKTVQYSAPSTQLQSLASLESTGNIYRTSCSTRTSGLSLSPLMAFSGRDSLSDIDSTAPSSDFDCQSELDRSGPLSFYIHRSSHSSMLQVIKSIEARTEDVLSFSGDPCERDPSKLPESLDSGDEVTPWRAREGRLSVQTQNSGDDTHRLHLLLGSQDDSQNFVDTFGTLSPVSNLLSASSVEDGLTLFVNPMAFCGTADDETLKGATRRSCALDLDEVLGLTKPVTAVASGDNPSNAELRKVEEKMGQQAGLGEVMFKGVEIKPMSMAKEMEETTSTSSSNTGEGILKSISIEEKVLALRSGPATVPDMTQKTRAAEDSVSSWSLKTIHDNWNGWGRNGIGHFREDTMWDSGVGPQPRLPFNTSLVTAPCDDNFQLGSDNVKSHSSEALKAAKRRAFLKSRYVRESRRWRSRGSRGSRGSQGSRGWIPGGSWGDEKDLDEAIEFAFRNVEPIILVRKGSRQRLTQSASCASYASLRRQCLRMTQSENSGWGGDLIRRLSQAVDEFWEEDRPVCSGSSGEATMVISQSVWSDVDDWAPKTKNETARSRLYPAAEKAVGVADAIKLRDRTWCGLCIGCMALLSILI